MEEAYSTIEKILKEVSEYVTVWLQYQSLWDMQSHNVYDRLGGDLTKWMQLLTEIRWVDLLNVVSTVCYLSSV